MKFFLIIFGLIILLLPSVHAIALGVPNIGEITYEPGKEITLEYSVQNTLPKELPLNVQLDVEPELSDYVLMSKDMSKIAASSVEKFAITIKLPNKLSYGVHSITLTVSENAPVVGAFVAHVGASHTVKIINLYPEGKPLLEFRGPKSFSASGNVNIEVSVKNIGRTDLANMSILGILTDGVNKNQFSSERAEIPSGEEKLITIPYTVRVPPGMYELQLEAKNSGVTNIKMQVGGPVVTIEKIEKWSTEQPTVTLTVNNEWKENLTEGTLALTTYDKNKKPLFEASATGITLTPGKNNLTLRIQKPKYLDDGTYAASLQVLTPPFYIGAEGELEVALTEVGRMIKAQHEKEPEAEWSYEQVALDQPRAQKTVKNNNIVWAILAVAIAIFLFSLAMILRKRREEPPRKVEMREEQRYIVDIDSGEKR